VPEPGGSGLIVTRAGGPIGSTAHAQQVNRRALHRNPTDRETYIPPLKPMRRRFRPLRFLAYLVGLGALVGILGFGYTFVANTAFRQAVESMWVGANPKTAFGGRDAITLLVLGRDEDRNDRAQVMSTNARSDVMLLARLDFAAKTIQVVSIPRDTRVHIPGTHGYSKINAAHAIGGPELAVETIHDFLGVQTDATLVVDYKMLARVVDQLGGVTVTVDKQLDYDDDWGNLHIHLKPGTQRLNGRDAMGFVRYRHANEGNADSDFVRIGRQQHMLQSMKAKMKDPSTWLRVPGALDIVRKEMRGSLRYQQLVALATFARSVPKESVAMHILPNRPGRIYVYAEPAESKALIAKLFPVDSQPRWMSERGVRDDSVRSPRRKRKTTPEPAVPDAAPTDTPATEEAPADAPAVSEPEPSADAAPTETQPVQTPSEPAPSPTPTPEPAPQ
jgi:polyisoprenyl-teichoic acid--peptidoglycan teichoic acid transferase